MRSKFIVSIVVAFALAVGTASSAQHAGPVWNAYASQYGFSTYPQGASTRFIDAYRGSNFNSDFAGILNAVEEVMDVRSPINGGDELLNASLEGWVAGSGM